MREIQLPQPLEGIVIDYISGNQLFWKHYFHDVLCDINEKFRDDDTNDTYFMRTHITNGTEVSSSWTYVMKSNTPKFCNRINNIIYEILMDILYDYDTTPDTGNSMLRIVYDYTGWYYGFRID